MKEMFHDTILQEQPYENCKYFPAPTGQISN